MPGSDWHLKYPTKHRDARARSAAKVRGGLTNPRQTCLRCGRLIGSSPSGIGLSAHKDGTGNWCR